MPGLCRPCQATTWALDPSAKQNDVKLNLYYTPTILTSNSLVFDKKLMAQWWKDGYSYAATQHNDEMNTLKFDLE